MSTLEPINFTRGVPAKKIVWSARGPLEAALLLISLAGLGLVPLRDPSFRIAWLGLFFAICDAVYVSDARVVPSDGIGRSVSMCGRITNS